MRSEQPKPRLEAENEDMFAPPPKSSEQQVRSDHVLCIRKDKADYPGSAGDNKEKDAWKEDDDCVVRDDDDDHEKSDGLDKKFLSKTTSATEENNFTPLPSAVPEMSSRSPSPRGTGQPSASATEQRFVASSHPQLFHH
jgi:hypothetical protein